MLKMIACQGVRRPPATQHPYSGSAKAPAGPAAGLTALQLIQPHWRRSALTVSRPLARELAVAQKGLR
jgi:hypothetical protein